MYNTLILNIDELWLKGKNRPFYFRMLKEHVREVLRVSGRSGDSIGVENHRFVLNSKKIIPSEIIGAITKIPGIHSVIPSIRVGKNFDEIFPAVLDELKGKGMDAVSTFRITTKRADKHFPVASMEVSKEIGHLVLEEFPLLKAKMKGADLEIEIRILRDYIYISSERLSATGGLPVGTGGHLVTMLSGGIDSPVASYLMSKRGCKQTFMFFYAYPMVGEEVKEKIKKLVSIIGSYQRFSRLFIIGFGDFQKKLSKLCDEEYRTVLFRIYMMKCGSSLASRIGADALLTGDSLGQVSSQTLKNIVEIDYLTDSSILRPLLGLNKIEIIEIAKKINTYETSIIPFDDACSMLAPRHPVLRADRTYLERFVGENDFSEELSSLVENAEIIEIDTLGNIISR